MRMRTTSALTALKHAAYVCLCCRLYVCLQASNEVSLGDIFATFAAATGWGWDPKMLRERRATAPSHSRHRMPAGGGQFIEGACDASAHAGWILSPMSEAASNLLLRLFRLMLVCAGVPPYQCIGPSCRLPSIRGRADEVPFDGTLLSHQCCATTSDWPVEARSIICGHSAAMVIMPARSARSTGDGSLAPV